MSDLNEKILEMVSVLRNKDQAACSPRKNPFPSGAEAAKAEPEEEYRKIFTIIRQVKTYNPFELKFLSF